MEFGVRSVYHHLRSSGIGRYVSMEVDGQTPPMAPTTCSRDFQQPHHSTLPPPLPTDSR